MKTTPYPSGVGAAVAIAENVGYASNAAAVSGEGTGPEPVG